jgi:hypothetical protein
VRTAQEFVNEWVALGGTKYPAVEMVRAYGEEVRKQAIAVINEARQEGEWDIRSVRSRIEGMKIE